MSKWKIERRGIIRGEDQSLARDHETNPQEARQQTLSNPMSDEHQYCTFFLDGHYFGIDVLRVQEIIRYQPMTRVPLAPAVVRGLINLRGQIVTGIDLRRRLGMSDRPADQLPINVVVQTDDGAVSLLVDEIGDVLNISERKIETPPDTLRGESRAFIIGVSQREDRLLHILDVNQIVNLTPTSK